MKEKNDFDENDLQSLHDMIDKYKQAFLDLGKDLVHKNNTERREWDLLILTVANRASSLCRSYLLLVSNKQYTVAAALIRMQLDNALRFYASYLVTDINKFMDEFLLGRKIGDMKGRDGKNLTDSYLVDMLAKQMPKIRGIYHKTSGYIHLSSYHHHAQSTIYDDLGNGGLRVDIELSGDDNYSLAKRIHFSNQMAGVSYITYEVLKSVRELRDILGDSK